MNVLKYIIVSALITFALRLLPFVIFKNEDSVPKIVKFTGKYLPPAIITGIVVYCFRDIAITVFPHGFNEVTSAVIVAALHLWKRNTLLSVFGGTFVYMALIRLVG
jgi:branched-subunit amino acid transport protein AzlD